MVMMDAKEIAKDPWAQKAAALIHDGRETIARSVSTQMRQFNPRFGDVDGDAQVQRVTLILQALEALLKGKSVSFLLGAAEDVMALGAMAGFGPPEFVKATHCYLPVLRRYFIRTDGLENGLAIFERVESVALVLIDRLIDIGADVSYHDPHIPSLPRMRHWPALPEMTSTPLNADTLGGADLVFILTDHTAVDYAFVADHAKVVVDTRGVLREPRDNVVKA